MIMMGVTVAGVGIEWGEEDVITELNVDAMVEEVRAIVDAEAVEEAEDL